MRRGTAVVIVIRVKRRTQLLQRRADPRKVHPHGSLSQNNWCGCCTNDFEQGGPVGDAERELGASEPAHDRGDKSQTEAPGRLLAGSAVAKRLHGRVAEGASPSKMSNEQETGHPRPDRNHCPQSPESALRNSH
jgi:hypothetical protein